MHEPCAEVAGFLHQGSIDLVGLQQFDSLCPLFLGLAHGHPNVGVDKVHLGNRSINVLRDHDPGTSAGGNCLRFLLNRPHSLLAQ